MSNPDAKGSDPRDELVEHLPAMRAFAISLTRNGAIADDMVQDTLVKAWTNIDKFQVGTNMRAWLFTILRNTYYSSRRKAKREVADVDGVFTESLAEKPAHDGHLQMNDFRVALGKLKVEQREALLLIGASGFSYEEAAEMCGVAVGTIKSRTNRARAQLAELMGLKENEAMEMTDDATMSVLSASKVSSF
ncbi:RNA polymerase sigma-70 factor (ECF subfamily) [Sulfitobacter undariae]|uniref:RNA polymerase sigma-70 factor (ECF subfamily) n=1 Tax=Sulfitobacter undariae TaxID=1563671 RepID=A0A7W6E0F1_9RHOB|nr:RNA polymerase sigma factor [Sulfitobacter undariae]MBB3992452.1 RNA polymerase sigma-70 factor (ECF subfamily) [Sulfitobacter undariae]